MKKRCWKIYCHTNLINGKKYVGQTGEKNVKDRWRCNGGAYVNNTAFWQDILKFDWNVGFAHELLHTDLTSDEADYWEKYYIKEWDLMNPEKGYNRKEGGKDGRYSEESNKQNMLSQPNRKPIICLETKQIFDSISQASRELRIDASMISAVCRGRQSYVKDLHFKYLNDYNPDIEYDLIYSHTRKVVCLNDKKIFDSIVECANYYNIKSHEISSICRGVYKTTKGLSFCYFEDFDKNKEYNIEIGSVAKKVVCIETKKIYKSMKECSTELNIPLSSISKNCLHKTKSANGLHFCFLEEYNKDKEYDLRCGNDFNSKAVMCIETGEIFKSIAEASIKMNICYSLISVVCRGLQTHTHGYHFKYYTE